MIRNYKLDRIIGSSGVFAGYILLVFGATSSIFSWTGIIVLLVGAVLAFTYGGCTLDTTQKKFRLYTNLFGFFRIGKWKPYNSSFYLSVQQFRGQSASYGYYGSRPLTIKTSDYRIYLVSDKDKAIFPLAKFDDIAEAQAVLKEIEGEL